MPVRNAAQGKVNTFELAPCRRHAHGKDYSRKTAQRWVGTDVGSELAHAHDL